MAYAVLSVEVVGKWGQLEQTLSRADAAMRKFAAQPRSIKFQVDDRVFQQIDNVRRMLRTIGTTNVAIDLVVNGESVAVAKMDKASSGVDNLGAALDRTNAKAQITAKNLASIGNGASASASFTKTQQFGEEYLTPQAVKYQNTFGKGVSNQQIISSVSSAANDYAKIGVDPAVIRGAITQLEELLLKEKEVQANRTIKLDFDVDPQGQSYLKNIGLALEGDVMTAKQLEAVMARMARRGTLFSGSGEGATANLSSKQMEDLAAYRTQWERLRAEARAAGVDFQKAFEAASHGKSVGSAGDINWESWHLIAAEVRSAIAAQKEFDAKQRELNKSLDQLQSKGGGALRPYLASLHDVDAAIAQTRALTEQLATQMKQGSGPTTFSNTTGAASDKLRQLSKEGFSSEQEKTKLVAQVKELDALMLKLQGSGGAAMLPFIQSSRTADEAILLASTHLKHLQEVAAKGLSMPTSGAASDRLRSLNMAGLTDEDDLARKARRVADAAANSTRKSRETVAEIGQFRQSMAQLESVIAQVRQAGGTALLPFIQSADTLAISIDRAKIALKDMSALNRIGAGNFAPDIKPGSGQAIAADFEKVNRVVMNTRNSIQTATDAIAGFEARVNALGVSGATPGTEIGKGMRKAAQDIREADKSTKSLGESVGAVLNTIRRWIIGYVAVSQLIRGFGALKYAIIDFNSLLEKARITLTTLFDGSTIQADNLMRKLKTFARITPFEFKELVPLTQRLLALGVVAKDTADKKLIPTFRAIGDTVASLGGSPEVMDRIVYAFGNMVQKGKASAEEVTRQLGNANVPALKYMAQAAGVSTAEIMKRMKAGTVDGAKSVQAILYGMATDPKFKGNMEKLSATFEGAWNNIKDTATEVVSGAFKDLFEWLSRQMQAIVKVIQTTKFQLDWKDKVDAIKDAFLALYRVLVSVYDFVVKFKGTLVLLFVLFGTLGKTNPFVLILLGISRAIIGIQQLADNWDQMSVATKLAATAVTAFGIALVAVQISLWIKSLELATYSVVAFGVANGAMAAAVKSAWLSVRAGMTFGGPQLAIANLMAEISSLALVALPLLVLAGGVAAIMWENYQDHATKADIANNNLAISLDALAAQFGRVEAGFAGVNSQFAKNSLQKMSEDFEKAKDSVGKLGGFLRKYNKEFINDLVIQSKLDPVDAGEVRDQFDKYIKEADRVKEALKVKVEVDNDPQGWAAVQASFEDAYKNSDYMFYTWSRAIDTFMNNTIDKFNNWISKTFDKVATSIHDVVNELLGIEKVELPPATVAPPPPPPKTEFSIPTMGPPVATGEQKAQQQLIKDAGEYYSTVEEINKKTAEQLAQLKEKWNKGVIKGDAFFTTNYYKSLRAALKERQDALGDALAPPKNLGIDDPDAGKDKAAGKARKAALKLENDRLQDAAKLNEAMASQAKEYYEKVAKASEDSAKRQIDALKGVRDKMQGLLGSMQDVLAKYGVLNSPLDGVIARIEKLTQLGPRMLDAARKGVKGMQSASEKGAASQREFGTAALHARMSYDKNNGGNGSEPARQFKLDQKVNANGGPLPILVGGGGASGAKGEVSVAMMQAVARSFNGAQIDSACATVAGRMMNSIGIGIGQNANAGQFVKNARAMGAHAIPMSQAKAGDLIHWHGKGFGAGGSGNHVGVYEGGGYYSGNGGGKNKNPMRIHEKMYKADQATFYNTSDFANGASGGNYNYKSAASFGRAGGVGRAAALNVGDGQDLMQSVMEELGNLKLGKFVALPKEFGASIKDAEGHASRFAAQMFLADRATQEMLKATLGESGFKELAGMIGQAADMTDRLETNLRARAETNELRKKQMERGMENKPMAQFDYRRRKGGDLEFLGNTKEDTAALLAKRREFAKAQAQNSSIGNLVKGLTFGLVDVGEMKAKKLRDELAKLEAQYKSGNKAVTDYQKAIRDDALGEATAKLKVFLSAEKDRQRIVKEGRKFIADSTVDTYGMARAQDLLNKKMDYARSPEMTKLYNTGRKKFNENLSQFERNTETGYDLDKGEARRLSMANARQELDRQKTSLEAQIPLLDQYGGMEALLNIELQKQGDYFRELYRLRGEGHDDERSRVLARELTARAETNRAMERQIALTREITAAQKDAAESQRDVETAKSQYASAPYGSEELERLQKQSSALKPLDNRLASGEFGKIGAGATLEEAVKTLAIYNQLAKPIRDKVDAEIAGEKVTNQAASLDAARLGSIQAQNALQLDQLNMVGRVSDSQKYALDLASEIQERQNGTNKLSGEELAYRQRTLETLRQQEIIQRAMGDKEHREKLRDMRDQTESLKYSPKDAQGVNQQQVFLDMQKIREMQEEIDRAGSAQVDAYLSGDLDTFDALQAKINDRTTAIQQAQDVLNESISGQKAQAANEAMRVMFDQTSSAVTDSFHAMYQAGGSVFDRLGAGLGSMIANMANYFTQLAEKILATYITMQLMNAIMPGFSTFFAQTQGAANAQPSLGSFTPGFAGSGDADPSARYATAATARSASGGMGGNVVNQSFSFPNVVTADDARGVSGEIAGYTSSAFDSNRTQAQNANDVVEFGGRNR